MGSSTAKRGVEFGLGTESFNSRSLDELVKCSNGADEDESDMRSKHRKANYVVIRSQFKKN